MVKKKFEPILNGLEKLSDEEKKEYVVQACEHLGVSSNLGLVELIWLDAGDSGKVLTLYVRKGATDIIRDKRGINVVSMVPANGDGYVAFIATGKDSKGRQEIAVGAVSLKSSSLSIDKSVMLAQTRASRRLTLQYVGGNFLDESELNEKTTALSSVSQPLSQIAKPAPQPIVQPNIEVGKDVTAQSEPLNSAVGAIAFPAAQVESPKLTKEQKTELQARRFVYTQTVLPEAGLVGGANRKLALFAKSMFPAKEEKYLTYDEWNQFFNFLQEKINTVGAKELVKIIDTAIGEGEAVAR